MSNISIVTSGGGSLTINSTPITGATGKILWDDAGQLQEVTIGANLTFSGGVLSATTGAGIVVNTTTITGGTSGHVAYDNAGTFGEASQFNIISGQPNVLLGQAYLYNGLHAIFEVPNVSGDNWFEGEAGNFSVTGARNFGTGSGALLSLTSGIGNVAVGTDALRSNLTGNYNTAIGDQALYNSNGGGSVALGQQALFSCTTGGTMFAIGTRALASVISDSNHIAIGAFALSNLTGSNICVAIGGLTNNVSGSYNVAVGFALQSLHTGSQNTGIGVSAFTNGEGSDNTCIGFNTFTGASGAGNNMNVAIGSSCAQHISAGSNNTWLGSWDNGAPVPISNTVMISTGTTLQLDFGLTAAGWTFASLNTPGLMTTNASGTVAIANAAPAATVAANFAASNRIQVNIGGTTYYIPADTVAW